MTAINWLENKKATGEGSVIPTYKGASHRGRKIRKKNKKT